jgi:hypothetical protein
MRFFKVLRTIAEQISLLKSRGMLMKDEQSDFSIIGSKSHFGNKSFFFLLFVRLPCKKMYLCFKILNKNNIWKF